MVHRDWGLSAMTTDNRPSGPVNVKWSGWLLENQATSVRGDSWCCAFHQAFKPRAKAQRDLGGDARSAALSGCPWHQKQLWTGVLKPAGPVIHGQPLRMC